MNYKITFNIKSAICFIDKPVFDGILAYCHMKAKNPDFAQKLILSKEELEDFNDLPIIRHQDGYFLASWMMFDEELATEFKGSWKKRWNSKNDHLVNFQKRVKKIRVNAGEYKSYDMPIVLHNIKQVWFYFASHDVARMEELISKYLFGIGKKTSFGQGEIEKFVIEAIDHNPFEQVIRPIPANIDDVRSGKLSVSLMGWKPPYWLPQNQTFCLNPS